MCMALVRAQIQLFPSSICISLHYYPSRATANGILVLLWLFLASLELPLHSTLPNPGTLLQLLPYYMYTLVCKDFEFASTNDKFSMSLHGFMRVYSIYCIIFSIERHPVCSDVCICMHGYAKFRVTGDSELWAPSDTEVPV